MDINMFELVDEEVFIENDYLQFPIMYDGIGGELRYSPDTDEFEIITYITDISDYELDDEERKELRQIIEEFSYEEYIYIFNEKNKGSNFLYNKVINL